MTGTALLCLPRRRTASITLAVLSLGFTLAGCVADETFTPYSPRYSYASVPDADGRTASMLMPDSCAWSAESQAMGMLPPGCSNAYNLQRMVESERDLVQGRRMGPAPAAPATRAARAYLSGPAPAAAPTDAPDVSSPRN